MADWSKPLVVDRLPEAFPVGISHLMPTLQEIPTEFQRHQGTFWNRWQAQWFYRGLHADDIPTPKEGIDLDSALRHLHTIQGSWEPKHEHKEAAVAYLASLWFKEPEPRETP